MFSKEIYKQRRDVLRSKVGKGVILLPGNGESPSNYPNNTFHFRQDSTFLYYFGQNHPDLAGVIDCESGEEILFGNDLEVYSKDERDISNMPYDKFKAAYFAIIEKACGKLKENAFAAIVVGDVRDKRGYYYNFVSDTIEAFSRAGLKYYNECVLINQVGTGAMRVNNQFSKARKVVKTHQNVLVFVKGNEKNIILTDYNYNFDEHEAGETWEIS